MAPPSSLASTSVLRWLMDPPSPPALSRLPYLGIMLEREASPAMAASPDPSVRPPSADAVPAEGEEGGQVKLLLPFPVDFSMPVGSILRVLPFNHARPLLEDPCEAPHLVGDSELDFVSSPYKSHLCLSVSLQ
jgi:hypothetical protein